jgi:hypothetical protein
MISFGYEFFQIIIFIIFTMPNKRPTKNKNSTNPAIEPTFNTTSFNDLTNIHLLLQQQQNQIIALSKAATQQQEVKKNSFNSSVHLCKK